MAIQGHCLPRFLLEENLRRFQPDVIILNACAAELVDFGRLIMDAEDVAQVITHAPEADIIISHMDNVAHASLSRTSLSEQLEFTESSLSSEDPCRR